MPPWKHSTPGGRLRARLSINRPTFLRRRHAFDDSMIYPRNATIPWKIGPSPSEPRTATRPLPVRSNTNEPDPRAGSSHRGTRQSPAHRRNSPIFYTPTWSRRLYVLPGNAAIPWRIGPPTSSASTAMAPWKSQHLADVYEQSTNRSLERPRVRRAAPFGRGSVSGFRKPPERSSINGADPRAGSLHPF
jgi:hypothetical protein